MSDEHCVLYCGAIDHRGSQRHSGALVNWRRRLRGYRKCNLRMRSDDTPAIVRNSRQTMSELNRRIFPLEWRDPYFWSGYQLEYKFKRRLMVLGRGDTGWESAPVGIAYRKQEALK